MRSKLLLIGLTVALASLQSSSSTGVTVAFSEFKIGSGNASVFRPTTDIVFIGSYPPGITRNTALMSMPAGAGPFQQWLSTCGAGLTTASRVGHTPYLGQSWAYGIVGYSTGQLLLPPNSKFPNCNVNGNGASQNPGAINMSSFHPGGANALLCDGSVRFLKDTTNLQPIWSLGSRAQGEVLSADSY